MSMGDSGVTPALARCGCFMDLSIVMKVVHI